MDGRRNQLWSLLMLNVLKIVLLQVEKAMVLASQELKDIVWRRYQWTTSRCWSYSEGGKKFFAAPSDLILELSVQEFDSYAYL